MNENQITISFGYKNADGDEYSQSSTREVFFDLDETELNVIGRQLNSFLVQMGYIRKNTEIFMKDISKEENDALSHYLNKLRKKNEEDMEENDEGCFESRQRIYKRNEGQA